MDIAILENLVPEFISYWVNGGTDKFIRAFWYFILFELTRYILLDYIIYFYRIVTRKSRMSDWDRAKHMLNTENPFISIVVPGKNEGKNIYKLVKSLAEQTYQNFELIVVDDGSTDDTPIIGKNLLELGLIDKFLRNEVRGGKASAANLAVRFSTGKFIVHLDADCSFDADAIENILVPFYMDDKIGAVGGNVKVRDYESNLVSRLQAIEYLKTISVGRITTSELGIYKIISGAFGAFRTDIIHKVGAWDIGPGLDGDITVKIRKSGYKTVFEPSAVCLTSVPPKFKNLFKQRMRWNKSIIRFRIRKHRDVYMPHKHFSWLNLASFVENVFYNVILDIAWWLYFIDIIVNYNAQLYNIIMMNFTLYMTSGFLQMLMAYLYSERAKQELNLWPYIPLVTFYNGYFLRLARTRAYIQEGIFKKSYEDPWNPVKSSYQAKVHGY